jgi:hypothetical protein
MISRAAVFTHLALLIATLPCAAGLKVKWTPAAGDKPMPFSKKYREANGGATWENSKEYGAQASGNFGVSIKTVVCIVAVAGGAYYLWKSAAHGGEGSTSISSSSGARGARSVDSSSVEQQRKARLARLARYDPALLKKFKASGASDEAERAAAKARRAALHSTRTGARIHQARAGSIATLPRDGAPPTQRGSDGEQGERFNGDSTALKKQSKAQGPEGAEDDDGDAGAEE